MILANVGWGSGELRADSRGEKLWGRRDPPAPVKDEATQEGRTDGQDSDSQRCLSRLTEISISCTSLNGSGLGRSPGTDPGAKTTATGTASWN